MKLQELQFGIHDPIVAPWDAELQSAELNGITLSLFVHEGHGPEQVIAIVIRTGDSVPPSCSYFAYLGNGLHLYTLGD